MGILRSLFTASAVLPIFYLPSCANNQKSELSHDSQVEIVSEEVRYSSGETEMLGYLAYPKSVENAPAVLVVHEWWGQTEYPRRRARMLAELGYVAMAVDMYGNRQIAEHPKDAGEFAKETLSNLAEAEKRFQAAMDFIKQLPQSDSEKIAAIGYCFGGGVVLHMARRGLELDGVASFHGSLASQQPAEKGMVKAKILVANGAADPMITEADIQKFKEEMDQAGVDYEFINYEGATHSFTNPEATEAGKKFNMPIAYNEEADRKSWQKLQEFLSEIF